MRQVQMWAVVAVAAVTTVANLTRELVALRRYRARRANLEHLIAGPARCVRVVDRDSDGAVIDITLAGPEPSEALGAFRSASRQRGE